MWLVIALLPWDSDDLCRSEEPWGCLGVGLLLLAAVPLAGTLLGWALLRVAGVRPAGRVAFLGGLLAVLAGYLLSRAGVGAGGPAGSLALPLLLAASYAAAAAVTLPGTASPRRWAVLGAALLLLWPLTGVMGDKSVSDGVERELAASRVPLLAPDLKGYRILFPTAGKYSGTFDYLLLPPSVKPGADDREKRGVWVKVAPMVAGFAPPDACEFEGLGGLVHAAPCEQVAPDTWRSSRYDSTWYIAKRQGVIVAFTTIGPIVPESDVRAMAESLEVRKPDFFTGG
ncbi:hypothetical protein [Streptomyces sp. NPDC088762]|uniref:hypothetical protein n=1 Tax=Streptomyces sp. NPDC088762 TaxID=3365891 RepID=UPI00380D7AA2